MKKGLIIIGLLILAVGALWCFYLKIFSSDKYDKNIAIPKENSSEETKQLEFSDQQLQGYYAVYENPYVLYVRKVFDSYLAGKNDGIDPVAIEKSESGGTLSGLDAFDKKYYKSKFIVFNIADSQVSGGKIVNIVFQDYPDKLFNSWVYPVGNSEENLELRGFWQNSSFDQNEMDKIKIQYKTYFDDTEHSI